jgi:phospholipid transport system transporter-binding protein
MIEQQDHTCVLSGDLTLDTLTGVLEPLRASVRSGVDTLDFTAVANVDSCALALIFMCQREARAAGGALRVKGLPPSLIGLASLYGVAEHIGA